MLDVIGSDPVTKYSVDPMLSPAIYKDCKRTYKNQNLWFSMSIYFYLGLTFLGQDESGVILIANLGVASEL